MDKVLQSALSKPKEHSKALGSTPAKVVIKIIQYAKWSIERISAFLKREKKKRMDQNASDLHNFG